MIKLQTIIALLMLLQIANVQILGPKVYYLGQFTFNSYISDDGTKLLISYGSLKYPELYNNTGQNYALEKVFDEGQPFAFYTISMSRNGKIILIGQSKNLEIYKETSDKYTKIQALVVIDDILSLQISQDEKYIIVGTNTQTVVLQKIDNLYQFLHYITSTMGVTVLSVSSDSEVMGAIVGNFTHIYRKENNIFQLSQMINMGFQIFDIKINLKNFIVSGNSEKIIIYRSDGALYVQDLVMITSQMRIDKVCLSDDFTELAFGGTNQTFKIFNFQNNSFELYYSYETTGTIVSTVIDQKKLYYSALTDDLNLFTFFKCPKQCESCIFPNNCTACIKGYIQQGGTCLQKPTHCVKNIFQKGNICQEYCNKKCKTCKQTRNDCYQCAKFYIQNSKGDCVVENKSLKNFMKIRPLLNFLKRKGLKSLFVAVDDLWLYEYHKKQYDGIVKVVFQTIRFIEEKQWEIIGLEDAKDEVEHSIDEAPQYNQFSNPTYLEEERKNNLFIDSTMDYFVFFLPATLILVFLFQRVFYLLFNYEVSIIFRPYWFNLVLFQLLVQNNVEYFTFLGFRSFQTPFSFSFPCKSLICLAILMFFLTFLGAFSSYIIYYCEYGKLARYFLVNLFRFPSSYILMIIMYGIRPFLKGAIHALLYEHWVLQVWLLMVTEILIIATVLTFQFLYDNHKSKLLFMMDITYYECLIILDVLILLKHEYFKDEKDMQILLEEVTTVIVYMMIFLLLLKIFWEYFPWNSIKKKCQQKNDEQQNQTEKQKKQQKEKKEQQMKATKKTNIFVIEEVNEENFLEQNIQTKKRKQEERKQKKIGKKKKTKKNKKSQEKNKQNIKNIKNKKKKELKTQRKRNV